MPFDVLDFLIVDPYELKENWAIEYDLHCPCVAVLVNGRDLLQLVECTDFPDFHPNHPFELTEYGHSDPKTLLMWIDYSDQLEIGCCRECGHECIVLNVATDTQPTSITWTLVSSYLTNAKGMSFRFELSQYKEVVKKLRQRVTNLQHL